MTATGTQIRSATGEDLAGLAAAFEAAESLIIATIERECEALRAGRHLAAQALRNRLDDAARLYLNAAKGARASYALYQDLAPEVVVEIESRRRFFAAILKIELAVLAAQRVAFRPASPDELSRQS